MTSILVDSNVIIDLYQPKQDQHGAWAADQLKELALESSLVVNPVIGAEVAIRFTDETAFETLFPSAFWVREDLPFGSAFLAGAAHRAYRERGGKRDRTLPDFLIGAHAIVAGYRLLTRDARRYRTYYPNLTLISPEGPS